MKNGTGLSKSMWTPQIPHKNWVNKKGKDGKHEEGRHSTHWGQGV